MDNAVYRKTALLTIILAHAAVYAWPDGAPCVHAVYETMNPLEAVEHQGGLQLSVPPFFIELDSKCYWANQPIALTLKGNTTQERFKGFAIQPLIYKGTQVGRRTGQFLRLDDNGSWQQQCFRLKDSVTHSHDEKKKQMRLWWKSDDDTQYVQFVATVVVSLRKFWVKTVLSDPLPPCRLQQEIGPWSRSPITAPPPVDRFKVDTFRMFNQENSNLLEQSISTFAEARQRPSFVHSTHQPQTFSTAAPIQPVQVVPQRLTAQQQPFREAVTFAQFRPAPTTPQPQLTTRRRLTHIIPLANMEMNARPKNIRVSSSTVAPFTVAVVTQRPISFVRQTPRPVFRGNLVPQQNTCNDVENSSMCFRWFPYCQTSGYMRNFCRRTCRFC